MEPPIWIHLADLSRPFLASLPSRKSPWRFWTLSEERCQQISHDYQGEAVCAVCAVCCCHHVHRQWWSEMCNARWQRVLFDFTMFYNVLYHIRIYPHHLGAHELPALLIVLFPILLVSTSTTCCGCRCTFHTWKLISDQRSSFPQSPVHATQRPKNRFWQIVFWVKTLHTPK